MFFKKLDVQEFCNKKRTVFKLFIILKNLFHGLAISSTKIYKLGDFYGGGEASRKITTTKQCLCYGVIMFV